MISANAIFHYTKEKAWLKSIINDNFIPRLSTEDISWALPKEMTGENFEDWKSIKIPMVCFCDIPLSQVLSHADEYGDYAIGLTKEWAIKHKICPIIYSYPESDIAGIFHQMVLASSLGTGAMAMISGLVDLFQKKRKTNKKK